jgi:branched-subunit amino acid transport protein
VISATTVLVSALVLGAGTFAYRFAGPALHARFAIPATVLALMSTSAVVLLVALVVTSTVTDGDGLADPARAIGVLVGGVLAWRRAPFAVVVVAAAATAALIRLVW